MNETSHHILIVEDEIKMAKVLQDYLIQSSYQASCIHRGDQALDKIRALKPSLILLDLMLPGLDGITICKEVRQFSNVPIIMVTARIEEIDRLVGLEIGADDYICKPFSPREVVARVKAVLRRTSQKEGERILIYGPVKVDEQGYTASVNNELLNLTPSEFNLLQIFIASPGRVFSRNELINRIQGYQFDGYDRTIDSHVKNLRKKLAKNLPDQDLIVTVYGVGYKMRILDDF